MSLNCFSSRAAVEAESELEEASKLVERAFNRIQKSDSKRERVQQAIKDTRVGKKQEMESHLQWLMQQKSRLERELSVVDKQLEEKRMRLKERTV
ncbi:hypothetical protein F441_04074 [Phytophthora nicotianae CJ01A1]|uniref:Uncharacterized protein n=6 Tax=Phytophthora nicotianae TaxID=4792 RepID=W2QL51_PHYN3|nr:hypothetical protein PPTG_08140 [Phytophthora nicotianae INRA-310]ETI52840.1 hypothetical protein F443_04111 [Phytophthora nicotianae P1569]ETK92732.1 hypothetical protein L915_03980 [Phytophthora nicotianae]ETO81538.1 hypothetical protein F444_04163 [Phytophthora nicotianae P1976]ETP22671.1 hypothetical protein F441_04074 [Phytophthora nicotianae CJ01A1]ETP50649.1 hypothetical protein F442_04084 [Phytophthora nicotianae P10297]